MELSTTNAVKVAKLDSRHGSNGKRPKALLNQPKSNTRLFISGKFAQKAATTRSVCSKLVSGSRLQNSTDISNECAKKNKSDLLSTSRSETSPQEPIKRIVIAVDDSSLSEAAVAWVLDNVLSPSTDELRLLHVVSGHRESVAPSSLFNSTWSADQCLSGCQSGDDHCGDHVLPLPRQSLDEEWAAHAKSFLKKRFIEKLDRLQIPYEVDLVKEYGPDMPQAIGHCICEAANDLDATMVVVAHHANAQNSHGNDTSISSFVAHYCRQPVILLRENHTNIGLKQQNGNKEPQFPESPVQEKPLDSPGQKPRHGSRRSLVFAIDDRLTLAESWAVEWAMRAMCKQGDIVHIVQICDSEQECHQGMERRMQQVSSLARNLGLGAVHASQLAVASAAVQLQGPNLSLQGGGNNTMRVLGFDHIGKHLAHLTSALSAQMLFVVNHSYDSCLKEFLQQSIPGQCLLNSPCPTVVFHANADSKPAMTPDL